jgi:hypothetical protein
LFNTREGYRRYLFVVIAALSVLAFCACDRPTEVVYACEPYVVITPPGPAGPAGAQGVHGTQGIAEKGETGVTGAEGAKGEKGNKGNTGGDTIVVVPDR